MNWFFSCESPRLLHFSVCLKTHYTLPHKCIKDTEIPFISMEMKQTNNPSSENTISEIPNQLFTRRCDKRMMNNTLFDYLKLDVKAVAPAPCIVYLADSQIALTGCRITFTHSETKTALSVNDFSKHCWRSPKKTWQEHVQGTCVHVLTATPNIPLLFLNRCVAFV